MSSIISYSYKDFTNKKQIIKDTGSSFDNHVMYNIPDFYETHTNVNTDNKNFDLNERTKQRTKYVVSTDGGWGEKYIITENNIIVEFGYKKIINWMSGKSNLYYNYKLMNNDEKIDFINYILKNKYNIDLKEDNTGTDITITNESNVPQKTIRCEKPIYDSEKKYESGQKYDTSATYYYDYILKPLSIVGGKKRSSKKTQKKSTSNKRKTIKKSKKSKMSKRK